jgi:two-component system sensor histidine kinase ChvG
MAETASEAAPRAEAGAAGREAAGAGASAQARPAQPSRLTRRIVAFNLIGLGLLVAGVLALNDFRGKLIELRTQALETQAQIIAIALAESAARETGLGIEVDDAQLVLDRLVQPARVRAQVFDRGARLMSDTRLKAGPGGVVEQVSLPADRFESGGGPGAWTEAAARFLSDLVSSGGPRTVEEETLGGVAAMHEVYAALGGETARGQRINARGELIVSVSVPIQTLRKVHGALVLSTRGGDIDAIVRSERVSILQVFLVALAVSVVLSVLLAKAIGRPIERLAEAALAAERGGTGRGDRDRAPLPDLTERGDEIGHLSGALKRMTEALYSRIEATEAFAADVAHEIKNPLSSLRSAVETFRYARGEEDRERLLKVMETDVARLDRLVTDISNASRLDAELVREAREEFDLSEQLGAIVEFCRERAKGRGVRIRDEAVQAPLPLHGIEGRLAQVFVNLLENAVSFSPEGGEIRVAAARGGDGRVRVTVEDEGPGIPDANLASVFERFYSERPDEEAFGDHSGLGLSISRQIVEAHGGSVRAENIRPEGAARRGARFVVELPG